MKPNYTHIRFLIDRSGSMQSLQTEVISGINSFIKKQAELPDPCTIDVIQFDNSYKNLEDGYQVMVDFADIKSAPELTSSNYVPRGATALLDSWGRAIDDLGDKLSKIKEEERPERVIFVVMTDGEENNSCIYNKEQIKSKTELQEKSYSWKFVYLGANQDAIAVGHSLGTSSGNNLTYNTNSQGMTGAFVALMSGVSCVRSMSHDSYTKAAVFDASNIKI